ncbi:extracellular solute-binding protein [Pelagicoccus albus]|uniref:ABC transporter substrate-binding protein n=1 Tax=Pelagicoccus albus TaxID=415222 RepID=A0A7X1E8E0_9BACT|nr:extracellular solute-binding protein [Pelagicoccus albus]MBC2606048.1 ABC transporter substrate-binding protein [Pelagicoccus albus]
MIFEKLGLNFLSSRFRKRAWMNSIAIIASFSLVGCGGGEKEEAPAESVSGEGGASLEEAKAYYAEHPEFFTFATPEDIPADIDWEDSSDLPEFASPEAKRGGILFDWQLSYPRTLRVIGPDSNSAFRRYLLDDYGFRVVQPHPNVPGKYYPALAEAWHIDWENKRVYFKLDPKATYSDGVKVTADDYLFMFYFMQQSFHQEPWSTNWYRIGETYTNITKYDDYTISIDVKEAKPDIFRLFEEDVRPVPSHHYKVYDENFTEMYQWTFEPTTGPYVVLPDDVKKGRSIAVTRLDKWWGDDKRFLRNRFNFDKRVFKTIRDMDKALEAFKKGELDFFGLTLPEFWHLKLPNDAQEVQNGYIHKIKFYTEKPRPNWGIWMNKSKPLLDNHDVRVGIAYALNLDLAIDQVFRGDYERANSWGEGYGEYQNKDIKARPFDIDLAMESFAKAGFTKRGPDGILMREDGTRLSIELTNGRPNLRDFVTILKEDAQKAGLEIRIKDLDLMTAFKQMQEKNHEMAVTAYNVSVELYPRFFDFYHSYNALTPDGDPKPTTNNLTITAYPEWDEMIDRYRESNDLEEIKEISLKLQELIHEDAAFIPAFKTTYYRVGLWRWMRYPEGFDTRVSDSWDQFGIMWMDPEVKEETMSAMRRGETFEPVIETFDQYHSTN